MNYEITTPKVDELGIRPLEFFVDSASRNGYKTLDDVRAAVKRNRKYVESMAVIPSNLLSELACHIAFEDEAFRQEGYPYNSELFSRKEENE